MQFFKAGTFKGILKVQMFYCMTGPRLCFQLVEGQLLLKRQLNKELNWELYISASVSTSSEKHVTQLLTVFFQDTEIWHPFLNYPCYAKGKYKDIICD